MVNKDQIKILLEHLNSVKVDEIPEIDKKIYEAVFEAMKSTGPHATALLFTKSFLMSEGYRKTHEANHKIGLSGLEDGLDAKDLKDCLETLVVGSECILEAEGDLAKAMILSFVKMAPKDGTIVNGGIA